VGRPQFGIRRETQGARELDRAVLVGILQANVEQYRGLGPVQLPFQLFFGDARHRHGSIVLGGLGSVKAPADAVGGASAHRPIGAGSRTCGVARAGRMGGRGVKLPLLTADGPPGGPPAAVEAA